jgi:hypothetical protein
MAARSTIQMVASQVDASVPTARLRRSTRPARQDSAAAVGDGAAVRARTLARDRMTLRDRLEALAGPGDRSCDEDQETREPENTALTEGSLKLASVVRGRWSMAPGHPGRPPAAQARSTPALRGVHRRPPGAGERRIKTHPVAPRVRSAVSSRVGKPRLRGG